MFFNSFSFFIFFSSVLFICVLIQQINIFQVNNKIKWRNILLLFASYYFYAFLKLEFLFLLLGTTLLNYICTFFIDKERKKANYKRSRYWLFVAVCGSLGILCYFKYVNFFIDSINDALILLGIGLKLNFIKIILPIGISFFTFQALTYTLDVYKGKIPISKSFVNVALFISFFPTILSGPIEKARNLLPQINQENKISIEILLEGGKRFIWGLFKKLVIADRLAMYINDTYLSYNNQSSLTLLVTAILYSFQIYADFSGYSDMAIGIARMLGFRLMENFNYPYFSKSIKEFWKRWHISLTSWFTEYVYIPLGGNRVSQTRWIFNIFVIFLLSGLWHGANWAFIFWGFLHAVYYLCEFYYKKSKIYSTLISNKLVLFFNPLFSMFIVFTLITLAWIFFRMENVSHSWNIINIIFSGSWTFNWGSSTFSTLLSIFLLILFIGLDWLKYKHTERKKWNSYIIMLGYACLLCLILLVGADSEGFVYFQF